MFGGNILNVENIYLCGNVGWDAVIELGGTVNEYKGSIVCDELGICNFNSNYVTPCNDLCYK